MGLEVMMTNCTHDWKHGKHLFLNVYCTKCTDIMTDEQEIKHIQEWLANRPSATMDPCLEERQSLQQRLRELKDKRRKERLPSKMMESQNAVD